MNWGNTVPPATRAHTGGVGARPRERTRPRHTSPRARPRAYATRAHTRTRARPHDRDARRKDTRPDRPARRTRHATPRRIDPATAPQHTNDPPRATTHEGATMGAGCPVRALTAPAPHSHEAKPTKAQTVTHKPNPRTRSERRCTPSALPTDTRRAVVSQAPTATNRYFLSNATQPHQAGAVFHKSPLFIESLQIPNFFLTFTMKIANFAQNGHPLNISPRKGARAF